MDDLSLIVNGRRYEGWTGVKVDRGLDFAAASFDLSVTNNYPARAMALPIVPGDECRVFMAGYLVITGYVDEVSPSHDSGSHTISVSGRSKTSDLVDASAINEPGQWSGRRIDEIVADVCRPFGIGVVLDGPPGDRLTVEIEQGETAFTLIERLCKLRGLTATDRPDGQLALTRASPARASGALISVSGDDRTNVLSGSGSFTQPDRFSRYIVKGQIAGSDQTFGRAAAQSIGEASDTTLTRYRPLLILADGSMTSAQCRTRAEWEASRRAGQSMSYTATVQGWRQGPDMDLWQVNTLVAVRDEFCNVDATLLVSDVSFSLDGGGRKTTLKLQPKEAYEPQPEFPAEANTGTATRQAEF